MHKIVLKSILIFYQNQKIRLKNTTVTSQKKIVNFPVLGSTENSSLKICFKTSENEYNRENMNVNLINFILLFDIKPRNRERINQDHNWNYWWFRWRVQSEREKFGSFRILYYENTIYKLRKRLHLFFLAEAFQNTNWRVKVFITW